MNFSKSFSLNVLLLLMAAAVIPIVFYLMYIGYQSFRIQGLVRRLGELNPQVQEKTISELVSVGSPAVIYLNKVLLEDDNEKIRARAASVLGKIKDSGAIGSLMFALQDKDKIVCENAKQALLQLGEPVIQNIITILREKSFGLPVNARMVLKESGLLAAKSLIALLGDKHPDVAGVAGAILIEMDTVAVEPLIKVLKIGNEDERRNAAWILGQIRDLRTIKDLITALKDDHASVRAEVARAFTPIASLLREKGDTDVVEALILALKDEDSHVRKNAAQTLGKIKNTLALDQLIATLEDQDKEVRQIAANSLCLIADRRALNPILMALKNKRLGVEDITSQIVYEFLVQQGKPGTETILIEALDKYGSLNMASDFRESGNYKLKNAGIRFLDRYRSSTVVLEVSRAYFRDDSMRNKPIRWGSKR